MSNREAALELAEQGFRVIQLHKYRGVDPDGEAKIPMNTGWQEKATIDRAILNCWWDEEDASKADEYNIGIRTGLIVAGRYAGKYLLVVDVDSRHGGIANWQAIVAQHNLVIDTLVVRTGTGGYHFYFICDHALPNSTGEIAAGIDTRGEGGYVVAPPSRHPCGEYYQWDKTSDFKIQSIPPVILAMLAGAGKAKPQGSQTQEDDEDIIPDGEQEDRVFKLACGWVRSFPPKEVERMVWETLQTRCPPSRKPWTEKDAAKIARSAERYRPADWQANEKSRKAKSKAKPTLPKDKTISDILAADFPELKWLIPNFLPEQGLGILAGAPKQGKSWVILDWASRLAHGKQVWGQNVQPCEVLYLALEDSDRRINSRARKLGIAPTPNLHIHTNIDWAAKGEDSISLLDQWMVEHPNAKCIFIDTLQRVREIIDGNDYGQVYDDAVRLKNFADRYGIAVVIVHHTRKSKSDDFLENLMGSQGLAGAADSILVLDRKRHQQTATLAITGRDVDENKYILRFEDGKWIMVGEDGAVQLSVERKEILKLLTMGGAMSPKEIADALEKKPNAVRFLLMKMKEDGLISKNENEKYTANLHSNSSNSTNTANSTNANTTNGDAVSVSSVSGGESATSSQGPDNGSEESKTINTAVGVEPQPQEPAHAGRKEDWKRSKTQSKNGRHKQRAQTDEEAYNAWFQKSWINQN